MCFKSQSEYTEKAGKKEFVHSVPQKITPALKVHAETASTFNPAGAAHAVMPFANGTTFPHGSSCVFLALPRSVLHRFRPSVGKAKNPPAAYCCARLRCRAGCGIVTSFAEKQKPRQPLFIPFRPTLY